MIWCYKSHLTNIQSVNYTILSQSANSIVFLFFMRNNSIVFMHCIPIILWQQFQIQISGQAEAQPNSQLPDLIRSFLPPTIEAPHHFDGSLPRGPAAPGKPAHHPRQPSVVHANVDLSRPARALPPSRAPPLVRTRAVGAHLTCHARRSAANEMRASSPPSRHDPTAGAPRRVSRHSTVARHAADKHRVIWI